MKPSERIMELYSLNRGALEHHPDIWALAFMQYLDEQHDLHKDDIQITQGR